jgi:acyl dehydratase
MGYGRYFEEFETGQVFRHWPGRTVNDYDNTWFSLLSMNQHPLWIDEHYARAQGYHRRPVADTLIFSLVVGMSVSDTSGRAIANLEFERVVFERRVFAGETLYAESEVLEKRESSSKPDRGIVSIETRAFNQNRERVLWLRRRFLAPKAPTRES